MKKVHQQTTADIQKEQVFLVHLERELLNVLNKINENLNTLKVEELQIRSNAINAINRQADIPKHENTNTQDTVFIDNPEIINRQELDLDVLFSRFEDENDEDEDS